MATINLVQGKFESYLDSGALNNGGTVGIYVPDGTYSTLKTHYNSSSLSTPNANPLTLDSAGRATIYFSGDADVRVKDSSGNTIYSQRNVNPQSVFSVLNVTTPTTLSSSTSGQRVTTTADITLPTAASAGGGWYTEIKNIASSPISVIQGTGSDTIDDSTSPFSLPSEVSVSISVNAGLSGFDIFYSSLLEIQGAVGQVMVKGVDGPAWTDADIVNPGSDLYLYSNFT